MKEEAQINVSAIPYHPPLAKVFGNCEALILHQVHFYASARKKKRDGHYWMWHTLNQWEDALLLSRSTIQRAIKALEDRGVIISSEFNGSKFNRTKWYRVDYGRLLLLLSEAFPQHQIQVWRDTELRNPWQWVQVHAQKSEIDCKNEEETPDHLDMVNMTTSKCSNLPSLRRGYIEEDKEKNKRALASPEHDPEIFGTEEDCSETDDQLHVVNLTTSDVVKLTTSKKKEVKEREKKKELATPQHNTKIATGETEMNYPDKPLPKNKKRTPKVPTTVKNVSAVLDESQVSLTDTSVTGLYKVWASEVPKHHPEIKFVAPFTMKQKGQMGRVAKIWAKQQGEILVCVIRQWLRFGKFVQEQVGGKTFPASPNLDYLAKHVALAKSFFLNQEDEALAQKPKLTMQAPKLAKAVDTPKQEVTQVGKITFRKRKQADPSPTPTLQAEQPPQSVVGDSKKQQEAGLLTDESDTIVSTETDLTPLDDGDADAQVASLIKYRLGKKRFTK